MKLLARMGVTPNAVTLLAVAGSIIAGAAISQSWRWRACLLLLPGWLFVRMALNAIDGMMARELGMATTLGGVLNEVGDVISDLSLYLPLAFAHEGTTWPAVAFSIGAVLTEFCGVMAKALGASRRYEGPMGKSDRAFVIGAFAVVAFALPRAAWLWPWVLWAGAILTLLTCWNRVSKALAELKSV